VRLAGLAERTFRDTYAEHNTAEDMAGYIAAHFGVRQQTAELGDPARLTLLAEAAGAAAGYVQLGWRPAPGCVRGGAPLEVIRFYVDRVWHGHGLAQLLMAAAVGAARDAGAGVLWLGVWERNTRAIAFYRKSGFEDVGAQTFVLGADHQHDRVLARPLT
jgi:GNAT superfamily N-acetyltransferase